MISTGTLAAAAIQARWGIPCARPEVTGDEEYLAPRLISRLKMVLLGALLGGAYLPAFLLATGGTEELAIYDYEFYLFPTLRGAACALLLYELIWRTRSRLSSATFPLYVLGVWYLEGKIQWGLSRLTSPEPLAGSYYSTLQHWLVPPLFFPSTIFDLIAAFVTAAAAYYLIFGTLPHIRVQRRIRVGPNYGGTHMSNDETTRLLCASAFTAGHGFRETVLNRFEEPHHATAPEVGVDIALVARVCKFVANRERKYDWLFFLIGLAAAIAAAAIDPIFGLVVAVLASAPLYFQKSLKEQEILLSNFQRAKFDASKVTEKFNAPLEPEMLSGFPMSDQNLIVYRDFTPFVGAGGSLGGWSFTVSLDKPPEQGLNGAPQRPPRAFESDELYGAIDRAIESLGLEHLRIRNFCFVHGADIRENRDILPHIYMQPVQRLDEQAIAAYKKASDARVRHYQWISIEDWGNQLVLSYFLRCAIRGTNLFVEINRYLLTPLAGRYHSVDKLPDSSWKQKVALTIISLVVGPIWVLRSVFAALGRFSKYLSELFGTKERNRLREIKQNPTYNYGAQTSIRQALGSGAFSHYFQKLDGDFYTKVLEYRILDAIVEFLDEHDIDTSEIRERRALILNSGIIVQGGDVRAESLAVGVGATASKLNQPSGARGLRSKAREQSHDTIHEAGRSA